MSDPRAVLRVPLDDLAAGERRLPEEATHYLTRVRRLAPGDVFVAFDPERGLEADAVLLEVTRSEARCRLQTPRPGRVASGPRVTLVQCAGKGDKIEDVIRSATALGVSELVFAESERTVVRFAASAADKRRSRLAAVALDAARQSGRGDVPRLPDPLPLADALARLDASASERLCLDPRAEVSLISVLSASPLTTAIVLLIGPEGGLSDAEYAAAESAGFQRVRLGPFVLRTELAAAAALGAVTALLDRERA
jgi:16S rRNA (uracil1498-N3)-methyltransferase